MDVAFAFVGFGEAGAAFAGGARARGFDRKTDDPATREAKLADFARAGVQVCETPAEALAGVGAVLCLVTADQALAAARTAAPLIASGTLWLDMNSVAPDTKRAAAALIEGAGGRYVDVAVMSPVHPKRRAAPVLVGGPHAEDAAAFLAGIGFTDVTRVSGPIGQASSIKMIRSVMVKGLEALTAECFLAADAAGVGETVRASLDATWPGGDWAGRADYNLDRMMVHGLRRAAEMEEVVKTLDALGTGSAMTRGTVERQRAIGALGLVPHDGLAAKLAAIKGATR
ncbi:NAD(P)-dependent oxidoreductase [Sphingomonas psychrotolerans]|uniref:NAD(P)-dependent oxidoreductase n=1 Tax=Sphingomonas psychrotolerans TaxID=1327635 RepID=A0A2K8MHY4_9SPHN|nr:NAD(P)-dependent oxidoreductase [Sphingomonas psychrotolerans]ATY33495.1 NAD(P)-dependent oxidoreductase [Sphingomonas psychrotolerans]